MYYILGVMWSSFSYFHQELLNIIYQMCCTHLFVQMPSLYFIKCKEIDSKCESQKRHINHQHIKFIVSILEQENFESYLLVFQIENEESKSVSLISSDTPSFNNDDLKMS